MSEQAKTREEYKKQNEEKKMVEVHRPEGKRIQVRMFPIWLRLVLLIVFSFIFLIAGATVGYGMLGNGKAVEIFKISTWTHIQDLVDKK